MDQEPLLERIESLNQSLSEISKRLGRLESSALPFDFGADSSDDGARVTSLLTLANDAIRRLVQGETQPDILQAYLELASSWVPRSVLFLNRNGTLVPWRASGLELDDLARVKVDDEASLLARCVNEQKVIYAEDQKVKDFGWADEDNLPKAAVSIPLCFDELVPVVLYADSDQNFSPVGLEFLSLLASLVLKNHALQQGHVQGGGEAAKAPPPPLAPPDEGGSDKESTPSEGAEAAPVEVEAVSEIEDASESVESPVEESLDEEPEIEPEADESPVEEVPEEEEEASAEEQEEEEETDEVAEAEEEEEEEEQEEETEEADEEELVEAASEEEEEEEKDFDVLREEALRFARLLVSEIKLYNSEAVEEGRDTSDIYDRLGHDIDRSRDMYERRVHPTVRSQEDCFDAEVVRILASGERDLLGSKYPGPRVD